MTIHAARTKKPRRRNRPLGAPPGRRRPWAVRRGEILTAAEHIATHEGRSAATLRRIAAAVGLTAGTIYNYFPHKDAIFIGVCQRAVANLRALNHLVARAPAPAMDRLRQILANCVEWGVDHPLIYRFLVAPEQDTAEELVLAGHELLRDILQDVEAIALEAELEGALRPGTSAVVAEACWATCHGLATVLIDRARKPSLFRSEAIVDVALDGLLAGLGAPLQRPLDA